MQKKSIFPLHNLSSIYSIPELGTLFTSMKDNAPGGMRLPYQQHSKDWKGENIFSLFKNGVDYYLKGQFPQALDTFSHIYLIGKDHKSYQRLSYLSYVYLIIILRWIVRVTKDSSSILQGIQLIEKGLRDLEETDRLTWRAPLLLEKAQFLHLTGFTSRALDLAEESYQIAKSNQGPSWSPGYHAIMVSQFSRYFNDPERSLQILVDVSTHVASVYTRVQVLTEHLRVLQMMKGKLSQAIDLSRVLNSDIKRIIGPRTILEAHVEMAITFLSTSAFEEGLFHLDAAKRIVLSNREFHRPCLVQEIESFLQRLKKLEIYQDSTFIGQIRELSAVIEQEKRSIDAFW